MSDSISSSACTDVMILDCCECWSHIVCCMQCQVKSGSIFDSVLVTDDEKFAEDFGEKTWGASKDGEKKMKEDNDEEERKQREEEDKKRKDGQCCYVG